MILTAYEKQHLSHFEVTIIFQIERITNKLEKKSPNVGVHHAYSMTNQSVLITFFLYSSCTRFPLGNRNMSVHAYVCTICQMQCPISSKKTDSLCFWGTHPPSSR